MCGEVGYSYSSLLFLFIIVGVIDVNQLSGRASLESHA